MSPEALAELVARLEGLADEPLQTHADTLEAAHSELVSALDGLLGPGDGATAASATSG